MQSLRCENGPITNLSYGIIKPHIYRASLRRFQAALLDHGVSDADVWRQIGAHAALGARVLRVFAFSNGDGAHNMPTPRPLQPEVSFMQCLLRRGMTVPQRSCATADSSLLF